MRMVRVEMSEVDLMADRQQSRRTPSRPTYESVITLKVIEEEADE
jgi:hypothetical protein